MRLVGLVVVDAIGACCCVKTKKGWLLFFFFSRLIVVVVVVGFRLLSARPLLSSSSYRPNENKTWLRLQHRSV
jgi:hypothetical protein